MSDVIHPQGLARERPTITVVKTGPFVVRHLAPGKPFLAFKDGRYVLAYPTRPDEMPPLPLSERLRYRINQWLISRHATWHVPPLRFKPAFPLPSHRGTSVRSPASRSGAVKRAREPGRMRGSVIAVANAVARGALVVFLGFMALMGVTRFVHVDVQTVFRSVHFGIPHFLTPWRTEGDPVYQALHGQRNAYPTIAYSPSVTPNAFQVPSSGDHPAKTLDDTHMARDAAKGWIPLPGGGPFPMNMPAYGDDGQEGAIHLKVHTLTFTSPDGLGAEDGGGDAVTLLGATPEPVTASVSPEREHVAPKKENGPRILPVHSSREPVISHKIPRREPELKPQPAVQPQPQKSRRDTVDVKLMPVPTQVPTVATLQQSDGSQQQQPASATDGPTGPKFNVVTKNGDALVVMDHGQMKQISVGQTLPDGSTLLSVQPHGGGFSTSRGNYVAY